MLKRGFKNQFLNISHCVINAPIWSFSGPHFAALGLNTEIYRVNFCVPSEFGKMQTRKIPNAATFHSVSFCFTYVMKPCSPAMIILGTNPRQTNTCSEKAIKTPERRDFTLFSNVSIVDFEQANVSWIST